MSLRSIIARWRKPKPTQHAGHVHIYAPSAVGKSLTVDRCPDCKQTTIFVGFHYEWHGWSETCVRCGRRFEDDEWIELNFCRSARTDNIKSAIETWGRYHDAERIHRVKVKPIPSAGAGGGETE